jgi:hypothetical protein
MNQINDWMVRHSQGIVKENIQESKMLDRSVEEIKGSLVQ